MQHVSKRQLFFRPLRLEPVNVQFWGDDEEINLRRKTFDVLLYLVDHPGQLVTKQALLDAVWPGVAWRPQGWRRCPLLLRPEERSRLQGQNQMVTQQRMLREMTLALEALAAEAPLVLLLEDLHWSDFSTLDLISAVARRNEPARLLIVGTYRPVEVLAHDHPLRAMKQQLQLHRYC